jgi:hypothetical protein
LNYEINKNITIYLNEKNLGPSNHTTSAITKILSIEENLITLDDDIEIFKNTYMSMSRVLSNSNINRIY